MTILLEHLAIVLGYLYKRKRRGSLFFRAYPYTQALALPLPKDKQRKPAHAERYYIVRRRRLPPRYNDSNEQPGYNTPTRTLRCITAVKRFKFARFDYTDR